MKKIAVIALGLVLTMSMAACGCMRTEKETVPTTAATTPSATQTTPTVIDPTIMDPTSGTNIPDPTVDSNSTEDTGMTIGTTNGMG